MDGTGRARYREIVAELRRRIEAGELAPGDRVPSTREITRRWGVAMATATKVLTELRHQGLVQAVPGVGTVVAAAAAGRPAAPVARTPAAHARAASAASAAPASAVPAAPAAPGPAGGADDGALTAGRIVAAAIAVADAEGLAAVSMRRVATELGAATMSLYRHVADKDDLLTRMMDASLSEWAFPDEPPPRWRDRVELAARSLWTAFRRHPWLATAMSLSRPRPLAGAAPFTEWLLEALDGLGLDQQTLFTVYITLFNYVRGTAVNLEMEAEAEASSGLSSEEWFDAQAPAYQAILATGRYPLFERLTRTEYDFDIDALFEFGLQRLLDGLATLIDG